MKVCNFIKMRLQDRCFPVKLAKFLKTPVLQNTSGDFFWKYLMNSLFIAYQNDERCHFVGCISSPALISFYCIFIVSLYVLYFCFCIYVYQHLKQSTGVVPRFLSGISRIGSLQPYLGINVTGLVQFGKIMSNILHSLAC